jgi:hypothetical protein
VYVFAIGVGVLQDRVQTSLRDGPFCHEIPALKGRPIFDSTLRVSNGLGLSGVACLDGYLPAATFPAPTASLSRNPAPGSRRLIDEAEGFKACSRWSSEERAIPPGSDQNRAHPEGMPAPFNSGHGVCWHPSGVQSSWDDIPVVALVSRATNRLQAEKPPASADGSAVLDCFHLQVARQSPARCPPRL